MGGNPVSVESFAKVSMSVTVTNWTAAYRSGGPLTTWQDFVERHVHDPALDECREEIVSNNVEPELPATGSLGTPILVWKTRTHAYERSYSDL